MTKEIKDPIYGYIEVDDDALVVINSIYFQRLRNIIQTSYTPIYPSSLHNRFTHSLGVYWLGKMAFNYLLKNSPEYKDLPKIKEIKKTFMLACLCHDLGHAPFSHTSEQFYDKNGTSSRLKNIVKDKSYANDLKAEGGVVGNEHEIMSALLSLNVFGDLIPKEYYSLFARCIIGLNYNYKESSKKELLLCRACVELLNSSIIDVDKLDYLIRDSYMSGYESIAIDYIRLLSGVFVNDGQYAIGYEKSALSVLESVLTANDMERRWVQAHPSTLYESYLIKTIIRELASNKASVNKLFSMDALTEKGVKYNNLSVKLLSDADILFLAKQNYKRSDAVKEYCNRNLRRRPFWKSEAEFSLIFDFNKQKKFIEILHKWENELLEGKYNVYSLNDQYKQSLEKELTKTQKALKSTKDATQKGVYENSINSLRTQLKLLCDLKDYLEKHNTPLDLVIISRKQFKSNIYKPRFKDLPIRFKNISTEIHKMSDVTFIPLDTQEEKEFFYFFYKRTNSSCIDVEDFSKFLSKLSII